MSWFNAKNLLGVFPRFKGQGNKKDARSYYTKEVIGRTRQDVKTWRDALLSAEQVFFPNRAPMMRIFYDTINNGHVQAVMNKRRSLTLLKDWCIYLDGEESEELTESLNKKWFKKAMKYGLDSVFYGYTLINITEIENSEPKDVKSVPRQYVDPEKRTILQMPNSPSGTEWEGSEIEPFVAFVDTENETGTTEVGFGLLYSVAYYEIFLRNLMGYNSDYIEKFGMPLVHGKTNKVDEARDEFEDGLANMGSNAYIVTDMMGDEVNFIESLGSSTGNGYMSYDNMELRLQKYITKLVLGHADAMDSQSGKLGSQQGEDNPIHEALQVIEEIDNEFVETFMNDIFIPKLIALGVRIPEGAKLYFKNDKEEEKSEQRKNNKRKLVSEYVEKMVSAGYEFDENEISEIMDMTIIKGQVQEPTEF